mmetsp:Transcript_150723/g.420140  ORF Transcript_150723/g.420140 Transcript_150723/m.420140 type:complete len:581 (-) Transcript_150723:534-2276(-)
MAALRVLSICIALTSGTLIAAVESPVEGSCMVQKQRVRQQLTSQLVDSDFAPLTINAEMSTSFFRACEPGFMGFSCVSGFTAGACRTASGGGGTASDFARVPAASSSDCASQCAARVDCTAFEAGVIGDHCEIWFTLPEKTSGDSSWICQVRDRSSCSTEQEFTGFDCIPGFEKGACRTSTLGYGAEPADYKLVTATSAEDCSVQCTASTDCVAFEASSSGNRCELWRTLPAKSSGSAGWFCRMRAGFPLPSPATTTTPTPPSCCAQGARIQLSGKQIAVDGKPLHLKGVNWNPVKKGGTHPWGLDFAGTVEADSKLMVEAGINAVRTYEALTDRNVLDKLWERGIYVLSTVYGWGGDSVETVVDRVNSVKDHPAILMWVVGNEWNYNGLYVGMSHDAAVARILDVVKLIKQHDADHPVSTIYGEIPSASTLSSLNEIDVWGTNVYRGISFGNLFDVWASRSSKPMYLGEYGADAWDAKGQGENQNAQALATTSLTEEIVKQSSTRAGGVCSGGMIFEFNDEWWKDDQGSRWQHDVGGHAPGGGPYPDYTFNEEWWGLVDIERTPRQAYYAYQRVTTLTA